MKNLNKANGAALAVMMLLLTAPAMAKEVDTNYPVSKWDRVHPVAIQGNNPSEAVNAGDAAVGSSYPTTKVDRGQVQQWTPPAAVSAPQRLPINTGQYPSGKNGKR